MAREITTTSIPAHLRRTGGGGSGKPRQATEFDELVLEWYENYVPDEWNMIPCDDLEDVKETAKAVKRATDFHGLGLSHLKEENEEAEGGLAVYVQVKDKSKRGPVPGSRKDPETGKMVKPDEEGYDELVARLDAAE